MYIHTHSHITPNNRYVPYFKLLATASSCTAKANFDTKERVDITYKCMRIIMRIVKTGSVDNSLVQWAALEALNTIKDTCPHGNVFQQESRDL